MKRTFIIALALLFANTVSHAQHREARSVGQFTKISFGVPGKLYLKQGSPQKVELEGDPEILKEIETKVDGDRLSIRKKDKWFDWSSGNQRITAYVTMPEIEGVSVNGSGDLIGTSVINTDDLELKVSGSGSLTLELNARGEVEADVSGSGGIKLSGRVKDFESDVSGSGKVNLSATVTGVADFAISGSGKIEARGTAEDVKAAISGSGKVLAADLKTNRCQVRISGSGDAEITVVDELDANISGSGSVSYRGDPKKVNANSSGSGKVRKM